MRGHYIVTHRQTKTCATLLGAEEGLEDIGLSFLGHAASIVLENDLDTVCRWTRSDLQNPTFIHCIGSIQRQVDEYLLDLRADCHDRRDAAEKVDVNFYPSLRQLLVHQVQ